ncbi:helix-turn-helix domain-containing protein [Cohnella luojiensis]|uniref:XRE family transcriptional regulator n=1 Tax=Cohnella luojiensis TaxID=652876 RepID=A0A4Y8M7K7_9BACL|nr:helix-turn-helix transcriptional regulator [Cohnella luojiensis]TFE30805.1 XRE family transcriptional regulator [Cohnella luojiensis]
MSLGSRIKELRLKRNFTQQDMADRLTMGRSNFGHIENDRVTPTSEDLQTLADILKTSTDYLLGRTDDPEQINSRNGIEDTPEIRAIQRAARNMSSNDQKKMLNMIKAAFEEAFSEDD